LGGNFKKMSLSDERKSLPIHSVNWKSFPQFILFEEDVKKHTQAFIEETLNDFEERIPVEVIYKRFKQRAEEEFGDLAK